MAVWDVMSRLRARAISALSMVTLPAEADVASEPAICGVLPSRMRLRMAGVTIISSHASARPMPSRRGSSCCDSTATSVVDSCMRTWRCKPSGNTSTMRSMESAALFVCSVASTKWPVSAAVSAVWMVSRSRISPTRMMSGSSRNTARRALL